MSESARGMTHSELLVGTVIVGVFVSIVYLFGWIPSPIVFTDVWLSQGSMWDGIVSVWYLFAWGVGFTAVTFIVRGELKNSRLIEPGKVLVHGAAESVFAGVVEELAYRWFTFFGAMFFLNILNIITFGVVKWVYVEILMPVTNWITFGILSPQLADYDVWILGAAALSANISFRDAHEHKGFITYVNSWFVGIIFFYLMFNYGLLTAIVVHVLYDFLIYATVAIGVAFQKKPSAIRYARVPYRRGI